MFSVLCKHGFKVKTWISEQGYYVTLPAVQADFPSVAIALFTDRILHSATVIEALPIPLVLRMPSARRLQQPDFETEHETG